MFTRNVYITVVIFFIYKNVNCTLNEESIYPRESRMDLYHKDLFLFGWISLKREKNYIAEEQEDQNSGLENIKCLDICIETSDSMKEEHIPNDTDNDMIFWGVVISRTKDYFYRGLNLYVHKNHNQFTEIYPLPSKYDDSHRQLVHAKEFSKELLSCLENKLKYYDASKFNLAASLISLTSFVNFEEYLCYLALLIAFTEDFKCSACSKQEEGGIYNLLISEDIISQKYGALAYKYALQYWKKKFGNILFQFDPLKVFDLFVSDKEVKLREFKEARMYFLLIYRTLYLALYSYLKDCKKQQKETK